MFIYFVLMIWISSISSFRRSIVPVSLNHYYTVHIRQFTSMNQFSHKSYATSPINTDVFAFDFDGVICASAKESSHTAILTAKNIWPQLLLDSKESYIISALQQLRPVIETGYETVLLTRKIYIDSVNFNQVMSENKVNTYLQNLIDIWSPEFRDKLLVDFGISKEQLILEFSKTRDRQISSDIKLWASRNSIYPSMLDIFPLKNKKNIIITTKQKRYVQAILNHYHIECPHEDDIFDLDNPYGSKSKVLLEVCKRFPESKIHFIEDRYETLLQIDACKGLENVSLYLADWGYNTEKQKVEAAAHDRILLVDPLKFINLLLD